MYSGDEGRGGGLAVRPLQQGPGFELVPGRDGYHYSCRQDASSFCCGTSTKCRANLCMPSIFNGCVDSFSLCIFVVVVLAIVSRSDNSDNSPITVMTGRTSRR